MSLETKEKLIITAEELIFASSYLSVSVAEICKRAGVNKGSFYHFFESKEELAIATIYHKYTVIKAELDKLFSSNITAVKKLDKLIELFYDQQLEGYNKYGTVCGCPFVNLGSEMAGQKQSFNSSIGEIINAYEHYMQILVEDFIKEGLIDKSKDSKIIAKSIHCHILGVKFLAKIENNPLILKAQLKENILNILNINKTS